MKNSNGSFCKLPEITMIQSFKYIIAANIEVSVFLYVEMYKYFARWAKRVS